MKRMTTVLALAVLSMAGAAIAQDMPALGVGGFYEFRVDNEVGHDELELTYYGGRIQFRDARWFQVFADIGVQELEWSDFESDPEGFYGLGGILWILRAEDLMIPLDLGLFGSFHQGDVQIDPPSGPSFDSEYTKVVGQVVIRAAGYGEVMPYLRAGMIQSDLDMVDEGDDGDWKNTGPAVNAGIEYAVTDHFSLAAEGNYSEGVGYGFSANLWF